MTGAKLDAEAARYYQHGFFAAGTQYYVAACLLFFAGGVKVAGNLAHHAVEMFLKGALCATVSLKVLAKKPYKHSLTGLWSRFKGEMGDPALASLDDTIDRLHQFEDLRYPDTVKEAFAILFTTEPLTTPPTMPHTSRTFQFTRRELDALVHGILGKAPVDPYFIAQFALNEEGRAALARDNATVIWTERKT
jgi:hypothetical protein